MKCCREAIGRSFVKKRCGESLVGTCCRELLEKNVVEKC